MLTCATSYYLRLPSARSFFFFNDTATTEIYTLSLHDALPISRAVDSHRRRGRGLRAPRRLGRGSRPSRRGDRKSTRLNSSHQIISYAVFCLKKKTQKLDRIDWRTLTVHMSMHAASPLVARSRV